MIKILAIAPIVLVVLGLAYFFVLGRLSQKGGAPGLESGRLAACPDTPNCVSSDASEAGYAIDPLVFDVQTVAPELAWEKAQEAVAGLPGTEITEQTESYLSAECRSSLFGFVDDLELQLRPEQGVIAVRSASRVGHSDLGANRKRVEMLRAKFADSLP